MLSKNREPGCRDEEILKLKRHLQDLLKMYFSNNNKNYLNKTITFQRSNTFTVNPVMFVTIQTSLILNGVLFALPVL
jgi:hypothetical protein